MSKSDFEAFRHALAMFELHCQVFEVAYFDVFVGMYREFEDEDSWRELQAEASLVQQEGQLGKLYANYQPLMPEVTNRENVLAFAKFLEEELLKEPAPTTEEPNAPTSES